MSPPLPRKYLLAMAMAEYRWRDRAQALTGETDRGEERRMRYIVGLGGSGAGDIVWY